MREMRSILLAWVVLWSWLSVENGKVATAAPAPATQPSAGARTSAGSKSAQRPEMRSPTARKPTTQKRQSSPWYYKDKQGRWRVRLYFYWTATCPHCRTALPWVKELSTRYSWLEVHNRLLTDHPEHVREYVTMAHSIGRKAQSVPAFLFCREIYTGFDAAATTGEMLLRRLRACRQSLSARTGVSSTGRKPNDAERSMRLPVIGEVRPNQYSLPVLTILLGGLDAFNPCAFFVLLFLLSLLVHARSRGRMLLIGGIFVFFSGFVYFLFMAAWLNVFQWLGELRWVTRLAGVIAIVLAILNIKDFFWFQEGPSLSMSMDSKRSIIGRMRRLLDVSHWPSLVAGTVALAVVANSYELLCTVGFPMVYTRILTLHQLSTTSYYLYLILYNVVYVIPLVIIVLIFVFTLGSRKLQEHEGRVLKLLSGMMMLGLGIVLLVAPQLLNSVTASFTLLACTLLLAGLIVWVDHHRRQNVS